MINEDPVLPGAGCPPPAYRDVEVLLYVREGPLEYRERLGHSTVIRPGELQRMSAVTGIRYSEFNPSLGRGGAFPADLDHPG